MKEKKKKTGGNPYRGSPRPIPNGSRGSSVVRDTRTGVGATYANVCDYLARGQAGSRKGKESVGVDSFQERILPILLEN